jgi:hypothetical protein
MRKLVPLLLLLLVACDSASPTPIINPIVSPLPSPIIPPSPTAVAITPTQAQATTATVTSLSLGQPTTAPAIDNPELPSYDPPIAITVNGAAAQEAATTPSNKLLVSAASALFRRSAGDDNANPTTWTWQKLGDKTPLPNLLAVNEDTLLAGDAPQCESDKPPGEGMLRSADGGATWANVGGDDQPNAPLYARPVDTSGDDLFAVSCNGVYRSTDNAASWQRQPDLVAPNSTITDLALNFDGSIMYFAASDRGGVTTLYRSDAQVNRWATPLPLTSTWGATFVRIGPPDQSLYFGSPLGLYVRPAGGEDWRLDTAGLKDTILSDDPRTGYTPSGRERSVGLYDLLPATNLLLLGTANGLYAATPGQPWQLVALRGTPVYQLFFGAGGLYVRTPGGVMLLRTKG